MPDPVLITEDTRVNLSETLEVEPRGEFELRGFERSVQLYAPVVPVAVEPEEPGADVGEVLADPEPTGLGRPGGGDGLGKSSGGGLGRPSDGRTSGPTHTLPG